MDMQHKDCNLSHREEAKQVTQDNMQISPFVELKESKSKRKVPKPYVWKHEAEDTNLYDWVK